jgi:hypothetical protein
MATRKETKLKYSFPYALIFNPKFCQKMREILVFHEMSSPFFFSIGPKSLWSHWCCLAIEHPTPKSIHTLLLFGENLEKKSSIKG